MSLSENTGTVLSQRIERYLESRRPYFQRTYGAGYVDVMIASEKTMLEAAIERGDLGDWKEGVDPITHIASRVEKNALGVNDSLRVSTELGSRFSEEIQALLRRAEKTESGVVCVGMNDSGVVYFPNTNKDSHEILSIGMGGCTQVVIGTKNEDGAKVMLFHYDPTVKGRLCDDIKNRTTEEVSNNSKAIIFAEVDEDTSPIEMTIKNALPGCQIRIHKLNLSSASGHSDNDCIRIRSTENNEVSVTLKGKSYSMFGTE